MVELSENFMVYLVCLMPLLLGHYSTKMDYMKAFSNHYRATESNLFFLVDFLFVIRNSLPFLNQPHHFISLSFIWSNNIQEIMYHHVLQLDVCRMEYISWQRYTWPNSTFLLIRSIWKCTSHSSMEGCAFSDGGNINISFPSLISDRTDSAWV